MNQSVATAATNELRLTPQQIEEYRRLGFLRIKGILPLADLATIRHCSDASNKLELQTLAGQNKGDSKDDFYAFRGDPEYLKIFRQNLDLRFHFPELRPIVRKLGNVARQLLKTQDIRIMWDKTFDKPPASEGSRQTTWHQDFPHVPLDRRGMLTFWIPLQDVTPETGSLTFVPRSHRLGPMGRVEIQTGNPKIEELLSPDDLKEVDPTVSFPLSLGDATVHDSLMFHGAGANNGTETRKVWSCIFIPGDTLWNGSPFSHANFQTYNLKPFKPFDHPDLMVD